jgi:hypothetical protein
VFIGIRRRYGDGGKELGKWGEAASGEATEANDPAAFGNNRQAHRASSRAHQNGRRADRVRITSNWRGVLALRWRHIHGDRIVVEERVYQGEFDDAKTDAGEREVPFDTDGREHLFPWSVNRTMVAELSGMLLDPI